MTATRLSFMKVRPHSKSYKKGHNHCMLIKSNNLRVCRDEDSLIKLKIRETDESQKIQCQLNFKLSSDNHFNSAKNFDELHIYELK